MPIPLVPVRPDEGLIFATRLPGNPSDFPTEPGDPGANAWAWDSLAPDPDRPLWLHLDRTMDRANEWLREESGLDPEASALLTAESSRPGFWHIGEGLVVILRGVDLNPGADPDELISIRLWMERGRLISLRTKRFQSVAVLRERASEGAGPETAGALLAQIVLGLTDRLGPVVENQMTMLDEVEDSILGDDDNHPRETARQGAMYRQRLTLVRRQSISLRRYLAPQRDALVALAGEQHDAISAKDRAMIRRAADQTARCVEDLDELRDRAAVATDELRARQDERIGRTGYLLTLVATIALPLGLITGLFGINVGGMPGVESPNAFWVITIGMAALSIAGIALFKYIRWL